MIGKHVQMAGGSVRDKVDERVNSEASSSSVWLDVPTGFWPASLQLSFLGVLPHSLI